MLIEPASGSVTLRQLDAAKADRFQPLTAEGRPVGTPQSAQQLMTGWDLKLGASSTTW